MIQTINLTKRYSSLTAVDRLNLNIEPGEIYGFLGPNGAGKTTTLLMILGILQPTAGQVLIFGQPLRENQFGIKRRIGVVAEYQSFYDEMTAWEYLMFFAELYQVEDAERRARHLLERVNLWDRRHALIGAYSTGMRRKLGFVRALIHSPDILILDEPVSGLDPYGILQIREILQEEHAAGRSVLISSHILSEVEQTADRVGIISRGRLLAEDTMDNLRSLVGGPRRIEVELLEVGADLVKAVQNMPFVKRVETNGQRLTIYTDSDRDYRESVGRVLSSQGAIVLGMRAVRPTLEEAFVTITEAHVREWANV